MGISRFRVTFSYWILRVKPLIINFIDIDNYGYEKFNSLKNKKI